mmetsp:Transcript_9265/g.20853  ORF Transcript_9265/g.20853 Transcript_9265/m.20853 type:complete len:426 (-) Transcript_9265:119-1396(-)|eukprot:CAMPEP_0181223562 /NCGR_PEP_ID=MMETSP1096-20121128/30615_1 /TAXON_ID=156174 ORGANISM="Chrysochromulina ericina, Strain CCMP281" /NCGR_SAMPLE_ID=MMETSP1096 /ASSEMBLY_ACC=CAM_ASM_000453 /LENGTH=425 /DNA_ID=CAMNT_0023316497 /DNA_START=156 /DNA_END=1433 /DNA_ORIENTATION=-
MSPLMILDVTPDDSVAFVANSTGNSSIPSVLLFNYRRNLLATPWDSLRLHERMMLINVRRTIALHPGAAVRYFGDNDCRVALLEHDSLGALLVSYFDHEKDGRLRSDMCRLAMLRQGGFYFDNDLGVRGDVRQVLHSQTTFVVPEIVRGSFDPNPPGFFQAFVAAAPHHPIIEIALRRHVAWYVAKARHDRREIHRVTRGVQKPNVGTVLLRDAFLAWAGESALQMARGHGLVVHPDGQCSQLFFESPERAQAGARPAHIKVLKRYGLPAGFMRSHLCSYVVGDRRSRSVVFMSRITGAAYRPCSWGGGVRPPMANPQASQSGLQWSDPPIDVLQVHRSILAGMNRIGASHHDLLSRDLFDPQVVVNGSDDPHTLRYWHRGRRWPGRAVAHVVDRRQSIVQPPTLRAGGFSALLKRDSGGFRALH